MWCASDNHNNMCHVYAKELLDLSFDLAIIYKISIFNEIAQNFTVEVTCEECTFSFLPVVSR